MPDLRNRRESGPWLMENSCIENFLQKMSQRKSQSEQRCAVYTKYAYYPAFLSRKEKVFFFFFLGFACFGGHILYTMLEITLGSKA